MSPKPDQTAQQPGADRFWGQFSQSKAGRSGADEANESPADGPTAAGDGSGEAPGHNANCLEWCPICRSAELFRATVSPELRQQAESIQQEAVGVLKAFLDAYAEKGPDGPGSTQGPEPGPAGQADAEPPARRVTDIPLD